MTSIKSDVDNIMGHVCQYTSIYLSNATWARAVAH